MREREKHNLVLSRKFIKISSSQINVQVCQIFNQNSNRIYLGERGEPGVGGGWQDESQIHRGGKIGTAKKNVKIKSRFLKWRYYSWSVPSASCGPAARRSIFCFASCNIRSRPKRQIFSSFAFSRRASRSSEPITPSPKVTQPLTVDRELQLHTLRS